jgi:ACS family tartrate transporter-like MFS transporter
MFILEGLPAIVLGIVIFFHLPDHPAHAKWLTPAQKEWLEGALAADPSRPKCSHLFETFHSFYDPRVLGMAVIYLCNTSANFSLAFFLPQIVGTMGLGQIATQFLVAVPAAMGVAGLLVIGWLADYYRNPRALLLACLVITGLGLAGAALFGSGGASVIGIAALSFAGIGIHSLKSPFWALAPLTLSAGAAAGGIAWINSVGNLGGYFGPSILGWLTDHFGGYQAGIFALAAVQLVAIVVTLALRPRAEIKTA